MFVIESIQPLKKQEKSVFKLTYPLISKLIGLSLFIVTVLYILISIQQNTPSILVWFAIFFMCSVGIFYGFRSISIDVDGIKSVVRIKRTFLFYTYYKKDIHFSEIQDITYENRWMGQTVQPKYRLFIETSNGKIDIGVVNQTMKVNYILEKMWAIIEPDVSRERSVELK